MNDRKIISRMYRLHLGWGKIKNEIWKRWQERESFVTIYNQLRNGEYFDSRKQQDKVDLNEFVCVTLEERIAYQLNYKCM